MRKKGWLIYNEQDINRNKKYIDWFKEEAEKQAITLELVEREAISIGVRENRLFVQHINQQGRPAPDFAVVRAVEPLLNLQLEKAGIMVFNNAETARIANDKAVAHIHAASLEIPMLDTVFMKKETLPEKPPIDFSFVIKVNGGRSGKQIRKIDTPKQWKEAKDLFFYHDTIIQQTDVIEGRDLRIFVIGKTIIAAVLRENDHDFRANISLGGTARLYPLSLREKELVGRLIEAFDFGLVGIDFLFDSNGNLLFNEMEDPVGSRSLSQVSQVNLLEKYVSHIKNRLSGSS